MRLRYKQFACRTLTLMLWLVAAYSLYVHHFAALEKRSRESRSAETENVVVPTLDVNASEWTALQRTHVTSSTDDPRIRERRSQSGPGSLKTSSLSTSSHPTMKFIPGLLSAKPTSDRPSSLKPLTLKPITPKQVLGKPVIGKPVTGKPVRATPVTGKPVRDTPVTGKPAAVNRISSASTKPTSLIEKTTKDPMDVYSDMGGIVIKQSNTSTSVNPHPFNYTLNPEKTCEVEPPSDLFLLVYVHTRPESIKQRELIRSTWGDVRNYAVTVRRIFVMGLPENEYMQESVKLESALYHDIVQENFLDTYHNLTYKAVGALRWVKDYCSNARFVLKTDDDAFVNMHILLDVLVSKHNAGVYGQRSLLCNVWYQVPVPRWGKWAVSPTQRKHATWPTFCQGLAYIITPGLAADLYNASFDVPFLWIDDVYVTGFLAKKIGIVHSEINKHYFTEEQIEKPLKNETLWKNVLFSHLRNYDRNRWAWSRVVKLWNNSTLPATIDNARLPITNSIMAFLKGFLQRL